MAGLGAVTQGHCAFRSRLGKVADGSRIRTGGSGLTAQCCCLPSARLCSIAQCSGQQPCSLCLRTHCDGLLAYGLCAIAGCRGGFATAGAAAKGDTSMAFIELVARRVHARPCVITQGDRSVVKRLAGLPDCRARIGARAFCYRATAQRWRLSVQAGGSGSELIICGKQLLAGHSLAA